MTSRSLFFVGAVLWTGMAATVDSLAQESVHLRPSYRAEFLPEDTEIIVLTREARLTRDGRFQPEFFSIARYPRENFAGVQKDRLGSGGMSIRTFTSTQNSGTLYFVYALTPDSTLFWSYSARRDSLKFDVVSTGVMSVAPISSREIREDVLRTFLRPRITVHMPEDQETPDSAFAAQDSVEVTQAFVSDEPVDDTTMAQTLPIASVPPVRSFPEQGGGVPTGAFYFLAILLVAASAYTLRKYHLEVRQLRRAVAILEKELESQREMRT